MEIVVIQILPSCDYQFTEGEYYIRLPYEYLSYVHNYGCVLTSLVLCQSWKVLEKTTVCLVYIPTIYSK